MFMRILSTTVAAAALALATPALARDADTAHGDRRDMSDCCAQMATLLEDLAAKDAAREAEAAAAAQQRSERDFPWDPSYGG